MIVGRFAPSPTGPLHIGSLVAAVGSYAMAKRGGGRWLLRMEDLDTPRVVPGCADDILRTLELMGFQWDGPVVYQSRRSEAYHAALEKLNSDGLVYPCACSRAEIARASTAPHYGDGETVYPGTCRHGIAGGRIPRAIRVRVGNEPICFSDMVMGEQCGSLSSTCGDFVVKRADGLFAYQLAVVVDDAEQGVTQVTRGSDLLFSTSRQIHLQRLLGLPTPSYAHLPLVTAPDGKKLSKRDNAISLDKGADLAKSGGALLTAALDFLGQSPPPSLSAAPVSDILSWAVDNFTVSAVPCQPGPLNFAPFPEPK